MDNTRYTERLRSKELLKKGLCLLAGICAYIAVRAWEFVPKDWVALPRPPGDGIASSFVAGFGNVRNLVASMVGVITWQTAEAAMTKCELEQKKHLVRGSAIAMNDMVDTVQSTGKLHVDEIKKRRNAQADLTVLGF